jgi:hypothetical protein
MAKDKSNPAGKGENPTRAQDAIIASEVGRENALSEARVVIAYGNVSRAIMQAVAGRIDSTIDNYFAAIGGLLGSDSLQYEGGAQKKWQDLLTQLNGLIGYIVSDDFGAAPIQKSCLKGEFRKFKNVLEQKLGVRDTNGPSIV